MQSFDHQLVHVYQFHSQAYLYCYTMAWSSQNSLHPNEKYSTYQAQVRCHMKRRGYWGEGLPAQGSKFIFGFGSTCATSCKFLGALPKF